MYKKAWCTCKVVVLLNLLFFGGSRYSPRRWILKSLMSSLYAGASEKRENEGGTLAVC